MAMKVHTFVGKANLEGLQQMNHHMNEWLRRNKIEPAQIQQSFGSERHHGSPDEPVLIISVWYHAEDEEF